MRNLSLTKINSQGGLSEEWIGEWAEQRCVRDQLVIATKVVVRFNVVTANIDVAVLVSTAQICSATQMTSGKTRNSLGTMSSL